MLQSTDWPQRSCVATIVIALVMQSAITGLASESDSGVRVTFDIAYLPKERKEKMDLYLPTSIGPASRPAILIVHGGGWFGGDKAAGREQNIGNTLAKHGYVCASINYALAEKTDRLDDRLEQVWPNNLHDCKTAVRFLRKHAVKYNINPDQIGAIGGSAGGHLVAALATTDRRDGLDPEGPYANISCRIQAAIPMYGVHDILQQARLHGSFDAMTDKERELCQNASPITYVSPDDPPTLILHGSNDALVPVEQSQILFNRLTQSGVPVELHVIEGAPHSFHLQPEQQDLREIVFGFLDKHLSFSNTWPGNGN